MKRNILTIVLAIILPGLCTRLHAQQEMTAAERSAKVTEWMKTNLKLTDAQVPQVDAINMKYANKAEDVKNSTKTKKEKMEAFKMDNEEKDAELKKVFTEDQYKTYQAKKDELKKMAKEKAKSKS